MRKDLQAAAKSTTDPHPGLWLERYAELEMDLGHKDRGKLPTDQRRDHIAKVCAVATPEVYYAAFTRWRESLADAWTVEVEATSRLLIGHGNPSPLEVGLTLHPVYGVPVIPGSALKGVLNHYLAASGLPGFDGVGYDGSIPVRQPGPHHHTLFGGPAFPAQKDNGARGFVNFEDAWLVPGSSGEVPDRPLVPDILTPHQMDYYQKLGDIDPVDWDEPNPVAFITVRPGARFLLAVSSPDGALDWAQFALEQLLDALRELGVGGKTASAGYGRLAKRGGLRGPRPPARPDTPALLALRQAVARFEAQEEGKLAAFDAESWVALVRAIGKADLPRISDVLAPVLKHRKIQKQRASVRQEIQSMLSGED